MRSILLKNFVNCIIIKIKKNSWQIPIILIHLFWSINNENNQQKNEQAEISCEKNTDFIYVVSFFLFFKL